MRIRAAIVDDEPLARRRIRNLLAEAPDVEVIAECANGKEAIESLEESPPDLLFLDIQMPEIDGFDVLQAIGVGHVPAVIFVTAYDQFALRAFEAHALDYLLKPFESERFGKALDRIRSQLRAQSNNHFDERLRNLLASLGAKESYLERMVARTNGKILIIRVTDVDWIEAAANYVRVHIGPKQFLVRETMTNLETRLDPDKFLRIHRSIIVRKDRIKELEPLFQGDYSVVLHDGTRLTSSRGYRDKIQMFLQGTV